MRCGPRTLAHVAQYHLGIALSDEKSDALCQLTSQGTSPEGMKHGLEGLGFRKVNIHERCSLDQVQKWLGEGAVVCAAYLEGGGVQDGHWSCLHSVNDWHVFLFDPDTGFRLAPVNYWLTFWLDFEVNGSGAYILKERLCVVGFLK